jgi:hypothetical protein
MGKFVARTDRQFAREWRQPLRKELTARARRLKAQRGPKMAKRVFLSFLAENAQQANGLRLLAATPKYADLEFYDESVRVPFDSFNALYIKTQIRAKISRTSVTVCLISANTHTSKWVDWELGESHMKGNKIIAMALKGVDRAVLPTLIRDLELTFHPWDPSHLMTLIGS